MIRHAGRLFAAATAIGGLTVAVIGATLRAALVETVGAAGLLDAGLGAAGWRAVALSAVARWTDEEQGAATASGAAADALPQNHFLLNGHAGQARAGWTIATVPVRLRKQTVVTG